MPIPLLAAAISTIGPMLAKKGLDLLSSVFKGTVDRGTEEISKLIKEKTGIDIVDAAEDKLTDEQWAKLKEFEQLNQEQILTYLQSMDSTQTEMVKA